jgi:hypothetical protein
MGIARQRWIMPRGELHTDHRPEEEEERDGDTDDAALDAPRAGVALMQTRTCSVT